MLLHGLLPDVTADNVLHLVYEPLLLLQVHLYITTIYSLRVPQHPNYSLNHLNYLCWALFLEKLI
jgi:hypothetical protein